MSTYQRTKIVALCFLLFSSVYSSERCVKSSHTRYIKCSKPKSNQNISTTYKLYRWVNNHKIRKSCNLKPSCSLFASRIYKRDGVRGLFKALARSQMEHSNQFGFLDYYPDNEGMLIARDPIEGW